MGFYAVSEAQYVDKIFFYIKTTKQEGEDYLPQRLGMNCTISASRSSPFGQGIAAPEKKNLLLFLIIGRNIRQAQGSDDGRPTPVHSSRNAGSALV